MRSVCNTVRGKKQFQAITETKEYDQPEIIRLVNKAAGGSFEAFGELYGVYLDRIYRYVLYQVKDRMTAEDITEEVFVKAWKAINSCKGKGKTFSSWIYRIAHNHIINTLRDKKKFASVAVEDLTELSDSELVVEKRLEDQELLETLSDLPQSQRQVVVLKFLEGMNNREIGQIMQKSESAIRILQMRALTALRQKLGGGKTVNGT